MICYPGGKSKSVKRILRYIPPDFQEFRSPFTGGGWVEMHAMLKFPNAKFWLNDLFKPTYFMWRNLMECPKDMGKWVTSNKARCSGQQTARLLNRHCQKTLEEGSEFEQGCKMYTILKLSHRAAFNRCGYTPVVKSFTYTNLLKLFDIAAILRERDVILTNLDYSEVLRAPGENVLAYNDPPYDVEYGQYGVRWTEKDHLRFADTLQQCRHRWILSYNDSEKLRGRYSKYEINTLRVWQGMNNESKKELLIRNF